MANFLKHYDIVYQTTSGRGMIAKNIIAKNKTEAKAKLKKEMKESKTFKKILSVIEINSGLRGAKKTTKPKKSIAASKVLQLMDKDYSYQNALKEVLKNDKRLSKKKLEKELEIYV
jgi:hypothetical protein